jgi:aminopeptidase-like protein
VLDVLESNRRYRNVNPYCEPQLGKRNLFRPTGGAGIGDELNARLWVLNFSDGEHSLLDIAERSHMGFAAIRDAADLLHQSGLLAAVSEDRDTRTSPCEASPADIPVARRNRS